ncbi:uncharacterized protein LOC107271744 [Cephus cinctus]|uniref:Uncharacterized protein LOC107271744 n=1 Tax=Cephus cinctus TaxID=211228 RepID=A0AAJ7C755_CEPCN|nr:uncharacterized protein LOC107271744 [Cephus cinctus]
MMYLRLQKSYKIRDDKRRERSYPIINNRDFRNFPHKHVINTKARATSICMVGVPNSTTRLICALAATRSNPVGVHIRNRGLLERRVMTSIQHQKLQKPFSQT